MGVKFIGAERELAKSIEEMNHSKIQRFMLNQNTGLGCVENKSTFSNPHGWSLERQIRSSRSILSSLLRTHSSSLDEESLNTLFAEVEAILNSRPLVIDDANNHQ